MFVLGHWRGNVAPGPGALATTGLGQRGVGICGHGGDANGGHGGPGSYGVLGGCAPITITMVYSSHMVIDINYINYDYKPYDLAKLVNITPITMVYSQWGL